MVVASGETQGTSLSIHFDKTHNSSHAPPAAPREQQGVGGGGEGNVDVVAGCGEGTEGLGVGGKTT